LLRFEIGEAAVEGAVYLKTKQARDNFKDDDASDEKTHF
jgi:hypothetical protein